MFGNVLAARRAASAILELDECFNTFRIHRNRYVDDMPRMMDAENLGMKIAISHTGNYGPEALNRFLTHPNP